MSAGRQAQQANVGAHQGCPVPSLRGPGGGALSSREGGFVRYLYGAAAQVPPVLSPAAPGKNLLEMCAKRAGWNPDWFLLFLAFVFRVADKNRMAESKPKNFFLLLSVPWGGKSGINATSH